ncbi:MAG: hypothetical protein AB7R89_18495 [Dehalococcoidia bacterium]
MIYEIRDYYVEPAALERYAMWVQDHALLYIRRNLDLVGFWIRTDPSAQVTGAPLDDLGAANITWIVRWDDVDTRNRIMNAVFGPEASEWAEISKHHPGRQNYRRIQARFMNAV